MWEWGHSTTQGSDDISGSIIPMIWLEYFNGDALEKDSWVIIIRMCTTWKEYRRRNNHICHDMWVAHYYSKSKFIHGFIEDKVMEGNCLFIVVKEYFVGFSNTLGKDTEYWFSRQRMVYWRILIGSYCTTHEPLELSNIDWVGGTMIARNWQGITLGKNPNWKGCWEIPSFSKDISN